MGVMISGGGRPDGSYPRLRAVCAHHAWVGGALLAASDVALYGPIPTWVGAGLTAVGMGWLWFVLEHTFTTWCLWCIRETPDNPQLAVERNRRWLAQQHAMTPKALLTVLGSLALLFLAGLALADVLDASWPRFFYAPYDAALVYVLFLTRRHQWLRRWCPYCKPWEDGGVKEPSPDPVDKGVKS